MEQIGLLDVVALTEDLPGHKLLRGQAGTVVEELPPDPFEVEFCDDRGRAYASVGIPAGEADRLAVSARGGCLGWKAPAEACLRRAGEKLAWRLRIFFVQRSGGSAWTARLTGFRRK